MVALPEVTARTVEAIYAGYEARQETGFRRHLGGSIIGTRCERSLWYSFRWATRSRHPGRLLRLFQTGHLAEARFVADLRGTGATVMDIDPDTGKQWNLRDETGHCGGSMDAVILGLLEAPKTYHGGEFKTHSQKSFDDVKKNQVQASKPLHWAQMQIYMFWSGLTRFYYLAVNKNTDELYQERIEADPAEGARLNIKGARIVNMQHPPEKIANNADWYECKMCNHYSVCWQDALPEKHCRSCLHSTPVAGGVWTCAKHGGEIPAKFEEVGCADHLYNPGFINGEVIDNDPVIGWVQYKMADGSTWTDGIPF